MSYDLVNDISSNKLFAALSGTIVGGILSYITASRLYIRKGFYEQSVSFRKAFLDEIWEIQNTDVNPLNILRDNIKKHELAVYEFRRVLTRRKRKRLIAAWEKYRCHPDTPNQTNLEQYSFDGQSKEEREKRRKLALKHLNEIIDFAK